MHNIKERLGDFSIREKNLWFQLLVDVAVALYYYPRMFSLLWRGDGTLSGAVMTDVIVNTVLVAIVVSVAISALLHSQQKPEPRDERDRLIEARSTLWSSRLLVAGVLAVIGLIVIQQFNSGDTLVLPLLTPLMIAHLLLFALMLVSLLNSLLKLLMYRSGV